MSRQHEQAPFAQARSIASAAGLTEIQAALDQAEREHHELGLSYGQVKRDRNMAVLRIAYLERMLEIQTDQMHRMQWRLRERDHVVPPMPEVPDDLRR